MPRSYSRMTTDGLSAGRRNLLKWSTLLAGASGMGLTSVHAQADNPPGPGGSGGQGSSAPSAAGRSSGELRRGMIGFMLAHEQFPVPTLVQLGSLASRSGFHLLETSDHLQPWQGNEAHSGEAWVTLGALGTHAPNSWMGTTVTCPSLRYNPAVVAEAFATLSHLYPGRIFLGVGSGEALNEQAATGTWPKWPERWDRLVEAITIIRQLWMGQEITHQGTHYTVNAKLYDPPQRPIPLLTAANGRKSMRLAGQHGDGLITDPQTWKQHKPEWEDGARSAGKNPADMPVLVEQYVVVGNESDARQAAELWRFGPKAFKSYYNISDPAQIQQRAESEIPLEQITREWPVGTDPTVHITKIQELFDSGASIVNIHSGQPDQRRVIEFYASHVLPKFRQPV
ncbi:MAG TPA: TIGR03557 family F420-dependent LLM class oxidoreductase [Acetobacteraceae bacterium]|nr:TIGR03557 family F420-dependent LLM class oxidoreductase [Acetobacteraceae bacterium]